MTHDKKHNTLIQYPCDSKISNVKSTSCKFAWRFFFRECQHRVISLECIVSLGSKVMAISTSNYDDARLLLFFSNYFKLSLKIESFDFFSVFKDQFVWWLFFTFVFVLFLILKAFISYFILTFLASSH